MSGDRSLGVGEPETGGAVFRGIGTTPWQAVNLVSSAAATPITILES